MIKGEIKRDSHAIGNHASERQQIIIDLLNPELEIKKKDAIAKSPKVRSCDLCEHPNLPRTYVQFKAGENKEEAMSRFLSRMEKGSNWKGITLKGVKNK